MEAWKEDLYSYYRPVGSIVSNLNELEHHGILGMKWGVRRFQNYDGSYTQEGRRRYGIAKERYLNAIKNYGTAKLSKTFGNATRQDVKDAKKELKESKKDLKKKDKELDEAYKADLGKIAFEKMNNSTISAEGDYLVSQALVGIGGLKISDAVKVYYNYMAPDFNSKAFTIPIKLGTLAVMVGRNDKRKQDQKNIKTYYKYRDLYGDLEDK